MKQYREVQYFSGKEAVLEAAHEKLSALKEITSFDVSTGVLETDYKIRFEECHKRVSLHQCLCIFLGNFMILHQLCRIYNVGNKRMIVDNEFLSVPFQCEFIK
jgi:hypothetical protein